MSENSGSSTGRLASKVFVPVACTLIGTTMVLAWQWWNTPAPPPNPPTKEASAIIQSMKDGSEWSVSAEGDALICKKANLVVSREKDKMRVAPLDNRQTPYSCFDDHDLRNIGAVYTDAKRKIEARDLMEKLAADKTSSNHPTKSVDATPSEAKTEVRKMD